MATLVSDWLTHFRLLLWNSGKEFNETWQEARSQHPLQSLCFGCNTQFILHGVIRPGLAQCCAKVDALNRTIKQYTSIESLFNRLLRNIIFPQWINIRAGQILPKIVIFFMVNFREARRLYVWRHSTEPGTEMRNSEVCTWKGIS